MSTSLVYLSHILDNATPTYGNAYTMALTRTESIKDGAVANESHLSTTTHIGTHIDLPFHFYQEGQTIESYSADFWFFSAILYVEIRPREQIIKEELIEALESVQFSQDTEIVLVKTGMEKYRGEAAYSQHNYGFAPELYDYLIEKFPAIRVFGFDTISLTSYPHPLTGRLAHRRFLNPERPLLILEDMSLGILTPDTDIETLVVAPLRLAECDGLPCTVLAAISQKEVS